jgi:RNA polymerase sigma factor (sigma-70 family)
MLTRHDNVWESFQHGDHHAFELLFKLHYDELFHYGKKILRDEEVVKDCLQDMFYKLWKNRSRLGQVQTVRAYLYQAFRRVLYDESEKMMKKQSLLYEEGFGPQITFSPEDFLIQQQQADERSRRLLSAMNQLTRRQREAIYLRFFGGMDYEKIAEIMEVNAQSVRNLMHQAYKALKENTELLNLWLLVFHFCLSGHW